MTLLAPEVGINNILGYTVGKYTSPEPVDYRLFINNITPSETDTAGTYTEATGGGYALLALVGATWTITNGVPTVAGYPQQTYTFTGPLTAGATIFGYFVTRHTTGDLMWAEAFTPFTPNVSGDAILITPQITGV